MARARHAARRAAPFLPRMGLEGEGDGAGFRYVFAGGPRVPVVPRPGPPKEGASLLDKLLDYIKRVRGELLLYGDPTEDTVINDALDTVTRYAVEAFRAAQDERLVYERYKRSVDVVAGFFRRVWSAGSRAKPAVTAKSGMECLGYAEVGSGGECRTMWLCHRAGVFHIVEEPRECPGAPGGEKDVSIIKEYQESIRAIFTALRRRAPDSGQAEIVDAIWESYTSAGGEAFRRAATNEEARRALDSLLADAQETARIIRDRVWARGYKLVEARDRECPYTTVGYVFCRAQPYGHIKAREKQRPTPPPGEIVR